MDAIEDIQIEEPTRDADKSVHEDASDAEREALASVMEKVQERQEARAEVALRPPPKPFLARPSTMAGSVLGLVAVLAFNAVQLDREPPTMSSPAAADVARVQAALVGLKVEAVRAREGALPGSLEALGLGFENIQYSPEAGGRFSVTANVEGQAAHLAQYETPQMLLEDRGEGSSR